MLLKDYYRLGVLIALAMLLSACAASPETAIEIEEALEPAQEASAPMAPEQLAEPLQPTPALKPTSMPTAQPGVPEQRLLTLEWPPLMRNGDTDLIQLILEVDEDGSITPTAMVEGNEVRGKSITIPNVYETHNVLAEARLDIAGMTISPGPEIQEPLQPGKNVLFIWSVRPRDVGEYRGVVWLHLRFIPKQPGQGKEERILINAQRLEIHVVNFLGLGGTPARLLGGAGTLLGSWLGLDNLFSWLWHWLSGRRRISKVK